MNFDEQLQKVLNDPETMNKLMGVAKELGVGENNTQESGENSALNSILPAISSVGSDDNRIKLISALRPFLSEKRAPYADSAVTILKMAKLSGLGKDLKLF